MWFKSATAINPPEKILTDFVASLAIRRPYIRARSTVISMAFRNARGGLRSKINFGVVAGIEIGRVDWALGTDDDEEAFAVEAMLKELPKFGSHGAALLLQMVRK